MTLHSPAAYHAGNYTVHTPVYEGPLDLLLQLIERAELDITRLALAQVTDQYLASLRQMTQEQRAAEEVSGFVVIASRLIQIKSEALLPRPPERAASEEDPAEQLAQQLKAYKLFKEKAQFLGEREASNLRTYLRLAPPPKPESRLDLSDLTLARFIEIAQQAFQHAPNAPALSSIVAAPKFTIRQKISLILRAFKQHGTLNFGNLLERVRTRLEIVVTFLAMLELSKRQYIEVEQPNLFGEIHLRLTEESQHENPDFELEFGE